MSRTPHLFWAVYGIIVNDKQEILLLKRQNTGYYDGGYCFPAWHIEDGEFASQALAHELLEEIGIKIDTTQLKPFHMTHRIASDRQYIDIAYKITEREGEITNNEPEKCEKIERFSRDNIPEYIAGETKKFINAYFSGEVFSEIRTITPKQ